MTLPAPNGCAACGVDRQDHLQRWAPGFGWHGWIAPDDATRKARMLARRRARKET